MRPLVGLLMLMGVSPLACRSADIEMVQLVDSAGVLISEFDPNAIRANAHRLHRVDTILPNDGSESVGEIRGMFWLDSTRFVLVAAQGLRVYPATGGSGWASAVGESGAPEGGGWVGRTGDGGLAVYNPRLRRLRVVGSDLASEQDLILGGGAFRQYFVRLQALIDSTSYVGITQPPRRGNGRMGPPDSWGVSDIVIYRSWADSTTWVTQIATHRCIEDPPAPCPLSSEAPPRHAYSGSGRVHVLPQDWPEIRIYGLEGRLQAIVRSRASEFGGFTHLVVDNQERIWFAGGQDDSWTRVDRGGGDVAGFRFPVGFDLRDVWDNTGLGIMKDAAGRSAVVTVALSGGAPR